MSRCFGCLLNGDASLDSLSTLLRAELPFAAKDGFVAALVVAAVLFSAGGSLAAVAPRAAGAFVLAVALHELVLVAGVGVVRLRARGVVGATPQ